MYNVLIIGSGGREHALALMLSQSEYVNTIYCAPGNAGTAQIAENIDLEVNNLEELLNFAYGKIDLTVVGHEEPLVNGIVDLFQENNLSIFGPTKQAAKLEGSKAFSKEFMIKYGIPTASAEITNDPNKARRLCKDFYKKYNGVVVKADGLTKGKGVKVCNNLEEAYNFVNLIMIEKKFGSAGNLVIIEEPLQGEEASILAITDGKSIKYLVPSQDHKLIFDGDVGENTGGMGAYAPAHIVTDEIMEKIHNEIMLPTIKGMYKEGNPYTGCLYAGLMIKDNKARVLEFNCRLGDPETQAVLPLLKSDLFELLHKSTNGKLDEVNIVNSLAYSCCVVMASGGYPGDYEKGKVIHGLKNSPKNVFVFHAGTKIRNNKIVTDGGRVLCVTGYGGCLEEAIKTAYNGVSRIRWKDEYHRTDIGKKGLRWR